MGTYPLRQQYEHVVSDTITLSDWLNETAVTARTRDGRLNIIRLIERYNGANWLTQNPYAVCKNFVDGLRKDGFAPYTVQIYRSIVTVMFESILGSRFSRKVLDRLVPNGASYHVQQKLIPERQHVVEMLKIAPPLPRAIIGGLSIGGFRITEWLSRKMSDVEVRADGHARVTLRAPETKARRQRYIFLTREVVDWINDYHKWSGFSNPEYVFPGDTRPFLVKQSAYEHIKHLFAQVGLRDTSDGTYTSHSYRTFASDLLRDAGLKDKYTLAIIGHVGVMGAESSYIDWRKVEEAWVEISNKLTFLDNSRQAQKQVADLTRTNGKLEALLEKLLERLS